MDANVFVFWGENGGLLVTDYITDLSVSTYFITRTRHSNGFGIGFLWVFSVSSLGILWVRTNEKAENPQRKPRGYPDNLQLIQALLR